MSDWHGAPAHTELGSNDTKATMAFMSDVFGLRFEVAPEDAGMEYNMAYKPGEPSTAVRPAMPMERGPSATPYYLVADIDKTIAAATAAGATFMRPKTPVPGGNAFMAWMQVPGGPTIAIMQN
jgi:predicted enzyme related to lactoylglutathione lyase